MSDPGVHFTINTFDSIVLGIVFISALIAFFRGFLKELLSFGAWIGAAMITIYAFPKADQLMIKWLHNEKIAAAAGGLSVYFVALISISILNSIILSYAKPAMQVGLLDNFMGFLFGATRGAFIICFGYLILSKVMPLDPKPDWLKGSVTEAYVKDGGEMLLEVMPGYIKEIEGVMKKRSAAAKEDKQNNTDASDEKNTKESPNMLDQIIESFSKDAKSRNAVPKDE